MTKITTSSNRNLVTEFISCYSSADTKRAYKLDLEDFLRFFKNEFKHPEDIKLVHLVQYRDYLHSRLAAKTVNRKIATIKSFLKWCVSQGLVTSNVSFSLKLPAPNVENPTSAFTDAEVVRMLDAARADNATQDQTILAFLFNLGLRRSELVKIKHKHFQEDRGVKTLKILGKGDKVRVVPINSELEWHLQNLMDSRRYGDKPSPEDFVFKTSASNVDRIVKYYAKKAGIDRNVSPHSCRATVISHLLENGVSPRDVADLVGHSSIQTTVGVYDKKRLGLVNSAAFKVRFA